jgi:NAD(P)-dependent dehydrogenase (short-subunit alcohol dehydrogenase family)
MSDRRIFITGGASGLGRALAERYAKAGWKVAIGDIHEARSHGTRAALQALGAEALFLSCDVRDEEQL